MAAFSGVPGKRRKEKGRREGKKEEVMDVSQYF